MMAAPLPATICRTEMREISRKGVGSYWCFKCRSYEAFDSVVEAPVDPMSYYGRSVRIECEQGHVDGDLFPGRTRDWSEW